MFRKIKLSDKKYFDEISNQKHLENKMVFAQLFAWKDYYQLQIYKNENIIFIKAKDFFFPPITTNQSDLHLSINWIKDYCIKNDFPFSINGITDNELHNYQELGLRIINTNNSEFLYSSKLILTCSEKQYHHKRKLAEQFEKQYDYQFLSYEEQYHPLLMKLLNDLSINEDEQNAVLNLINNLKELSCFCDCIFIGDDLIAFLIGKPNDEGLILYEAVDPAYQGCHSLLIQKSSNKHFPYNQFIRHLNNNEKTRKLLLSYHPINIIERYQATLDIPIQLKGLYDNSFNDSEAYKHYFFNHKEKQLLYLTHNNIITSTLYYRGHLISIKNNLYTSVILFALATTPLYRNQGFMKKLITQAFAELYPKYILAYLHPDVDDFYEKYGFIKYGARFPILKNIKTTKANLEIINSIYQEYVKFYDVYTIRDISFWIKFQQELESDSGYLKLLENHRGYLAHDGDQIIEYCDLDNLATGNNYNMIRIINLKAFLEIYSYQPKTNLQIIDNMIPENNILIMINDGDITNISITDFTKTIFNNLSSLSLEKY